MMFAFKLKDFLVKTDLDRYHYLHLLKIIPLDINLKAQILGGDARFLSDRISFGSASSVAVCTKFILRF